MAIAGAILTGGATLGLYSATSSLATLGTNLTLASSALSAAQSAYNGDWTGAIFSLAMTVVSYQISNINTELSQANKAVDVAKQTKNAAQIAETTNYFNNLKASLEPTLKSLKTFQASAQGAYNAYRAAESGNNTLAFLSVIQGVANAVAVNTLNWGETLDKTSSFSNLEKAFITAGQVSVTAYKSLEAIQSGNLNDGLKLIGEIAKEVGTNFASELVGTKLDGDWLSLKVIVTAGKISLNVHEAVQALEDEEWIDAFQAINKIVKGVRENFNQPSQGNNNGTPNSSNSQEGVNVEKVKSTFDKLKDKFEEYKGKLETFVKDNFGVDFNDIEKISKTVNIGEKLSKDFNAKVWVKGIEDILKVWQDDLRSLVNRNFYDDDLAALAKQFKVNPPDLQVGENRDIYYLGNGGLKITIGVKKSLDNLTNLLEISPRARLEGEKLDKLSLVDMAISLEELPEELRAEVITYLREKYGDPESWLAAHPILVASNNGNLPLASMAAQNQLRATLFTEKYRINWKIISELEGGQELKGYIPKDQGKVLDKSGVTIATGFDLGSHSETDLKKMGFPTALIEKFKPFLGVKGEAADQKLQQYGKDLLITSEEAKTIDILKKADIVEKLEKNYNANSQVKFQELSESAQTAIASVIFQHGVGGAPKFLQYAAQQDWDQVLRELHNFGGKYPTRRRKEAYLLAESIYNMQHSFSVKKTYDIEALDPLIRLGKIDTLTGKDNQGDLFILGNNKGSFYNRANDYVQILNFSDRQDKIQLHGKPSDYVLSPTEKGLGIYLKTSTQNDLIGILEGINNFNLNTQVIFIPPP